jgi:hypothetical protein
MSDGIVNKQSQFAEPAGRRLGRQLYKQDAADKSQDRPTRSLMLAQKRRSKSDLGTFVVGVKQSQFGLVAYRAKRSQSPADKVSHHSTIPSFQHSNLTPAVQTKPISESRPEAWGSLVQTKPIGRGGRSRQTKPVSGGRDTPSFHYSIIPPFQSDAACTNKANFRSSGRRAGSRTRHRMPSTPGRTKENAFAFRRESAILCPLQNARHAALRNAGTGGNNDQIANDP